MKWHLLFLICLISLANGQVWQCPITRGNVNTAMISSDFGPRNHSSWFHQGIDLAYPRLTPVYPVEAGNARYVPRSAERIIRVWHHFRDPRGRGDSIPSRYVHNDSIAIDTIGNPVYVTKNTVIAFVGDKGCEGNVHLHFDFSYPPGDPWFSPLLLLPYDNSHNPGPIEFINLTNGQEVSGVCTVRVRILTTVDKDLNAAVLLLNNQKVDSISYDPRTAGVTVPRKKVEPQGVGDDIFKFLWNTLNFSNGEYTLTCKAYDVRGRVGDSAIRVQVNNFSDVDVSRINRPSHGSRIPKNQQVVPTATIKNVGTRPESLSSVYFLIRQDGNSQYFRWVTYNPKKALKPGEQMVCQFPGWVPTSSGLCTAKCYTYISRDSNRYNDTAYSIFTVSEDDGGGDREGIRHREDFNRPNPPYNCNPSQSPCGECCYCAGRGSPCCLCGGNSSCSGCCACNRNCGGCCVCQGGFPLWPPAGWHSFFQMATFKTCWHRKTGSPWTANPTPYALLDWDFNGGTVIESLISPIIDLSSCTTVVLRCSTYFKIKSNHTDYTARLVGSIDGGATYPYLIRDYVGNNFGPGVESFNISSWARRRSRVRFAWVYIGKVNRIDFWAVDNVTVLGLPAREHDLSVNEIWTPKGAVPYNTKLRPKVTINNFGKNWETTKVYCKIDGTYTDSVRVRLRPGSSSIVRFREWSASPGPHTIKVYFSLSADENQANDTAVIQFRVVADTWLVKERALAGIKSGGCLTATDKYIYALTGYPNMGFLRYSPEDNQWRRMEPPPRDADAGAALAWTGGDYIYASEGCGSQRFYRYNVKTNQWSVMASLPGRVGWGGALTWTGGDYLFKLRGGEKRDFYRYRISTNSWDTLPQTPEKIGGGGALTWDRNKSLYALRGSDDHDFYRYQINNNTWYTLPLVPFRVGRGGSLTFDTSNNKVYALCGKGRNEFLVFSPSSNFWSQRTPTPQPVNYGGAILFYKGSIYAVRGGDNRDFWNYALPIGGLLGGAQSPPPEVKGETTLFFDCAKPVFSPTGDWICYQKLDSNPSYQLYKMSITSGEEIQLTNDEASYQNPQWFPDSEWVVCERDGEIYKLRSDGSDGEVLATGLCANPQWSPDGEFVVFTKWDGKHNLYLISSDGSYEEQILADDGNVRFPQWSPDGEWIIYQKMDGDFWQIYKISLSTGEEIKLTNSITDNTNPNVSPEGSWVVYERVDENGYRQIYRTSLNGGEEIPLTFETCDHESPKISPDGNWIVYIKWLKDSLGGYQSTQICYIPATGGTEVPVTDAVGIKENPSWSPDCQLIVYEETSTDNKSGDCRRIGIVRTGLIYQNPPKKMANLPLVFALRQNRPNPFKELTRISFAIPKECFVSLIIYDASGRRVRDLISRELKPGDHTLRWDGRDDRGKDLPQGIYFYQLKALDFKDIKKTVLLR